MRVQEFVAKRGDGSKRLLLMVAAGARQAAEEARVAGAGSAWASLLRPSLVALCHSLAALQVSRVSVTWCTCFVLCVWPV